MENIISRPKYLALIEQYLHKQTIIVLTGQRRVGKSCVLKEFAHAKQLDAQANIIYIDKERREFDELISYTQLNTYIETHLEASKTNYILIDEVQDIEQFEKSLRSFYQEPNCEIVITGSNAQMLSSELSTLLGGRYHEIYIQSLTYEEYLRFHELPNTDESLRLYIETGGLPGLIHYDIHDEQQVMTYIGDVYNTVLLKDVVLRHHVRNVPFLRNLCRFVADNTGKLFSANNISKYMRSTQSAVTTDLVLKYLMHLAQAYILAQVRRYDIHGKRILETNDKYYYEDHGIRNMLVGGCHDTDIEKVIENIVYQQLIYMGFEVAVGQLQVGEVDFVCTRSTGERCYVQVSYLIASEETREREFGRLEAIKDNYPKYVLSMTPLVQRADANGITHLSLREFLTKGLGNRGLKIDY